MALAHEFQHLRQGDISWEIMIEFLRPLFFGTQHLFYGNAR